MRVPLTIIISALWLMTPAPESYVVIGLLLWLNQTREPFATFFRVAWRHAPIPLPPGLSKC